MSGFESWKDGYRAELQRAISFSGQDVDFFTEVKARYLVELAERRVGRAAGLSALDVGCGVGETDRFLADRLGRLCGVDVVPQVLERAASENPSVDYRVYDGETLPFPDGSFDVSFAICVLHHVPVPARPRFVSEVARVTRPSGLVAIFEHNPNNPLTRLAVARCDWDDDALLLRTREVRDLLDRAGVKSLERRFITFFPVTSRHLEAAERRLGWLPVGAQYYLAGAPRPARGPRAGGVIGPVRPSA